MVRKVNLLLSIDICSGKRFKCILKKQKRKFCVSVTVIKLSQRVRLNQKKFCCKVQCMSILFYGSHVWRFAKKEMRRVVVSHNNANRRVL